MRRKKGTFEKGFTPNWTEEVFTIKAVKATKPPTYTIENTLGEQVQGTVGSIGTMDVTKNAIPHVIAHKLATTIARMRKMVDKDVTGSQEPQLQ